MNITLVNRAIEQCRASQGHLDASRRLLSHSRRLLNRAWWIAGASDDNDGLRLKIRDRLIKGALFPPPIRVWAGPGTGRRCVICGTTISSRDVECEMNIGPGHNLGSPHALPHGVAGGVSASQRVESR